MTGTVRTLASLPPGVEGGYMYAVAGRGGAEVLYSRFSHRGCETRRSSPGPWAIYDLIDHR